MKFVTTKETEYQRKMRELKEFPENHLHKDLNELHACCMITPGDGGTPALDLSLIQAHSDYCAVGFNGGSRCDVLDGPCACGAWHKLKENRKGLTPLGQKLRKKLLGKTK